jgi:hypothetical protein
LQADKASHKQPGVTTSPPQPAACRSTPDALEIVNSRSSQLHGIGSLTDTDAMRSALVERGYPLPDVPGLTAERAQERVKDEFLAARFFDDLRIGTANASQAFQGCSFSGRPQEVTLFCPWPVVAIARNAILAVQSALGNDSDQTRFVVLNFSSESPKMLQDSIPALARLMGLCEDGRWAAFTQEAPRGAQTSLMHLFDLRSQDRFVSTYPWHDEGHVAFTTGGREMLTVCPNPLSGGASLKRFDLMTTPPSFSTTPIDWPAEAWRRSEILASRCGRWFGFFGSLPSGGDGIRAGRMALFGLQGDNKRIELSFDRPYERLGSLLLSEEEDKLLVRTTWTTGRGQRLFDLLADHSGGEDLGAECLRPVFNMNGGLSYRVTSGSTAAIFHPIRFQLLRRYASAEQVYRHDRIQLGPSPQNPNALKVTFF